MLTKEPSPVFFEDLDMVDLCHSLCTMPICIWLMWTRQRTRESHNPVIMSLALYCCVVRKCACMYVCVRAFARVTVFVQYRRVLCVCVFERKNKDSIWSEPLNVPVWNSSVILKSLFEAARRWSGARRRAARGSYLRQPLTQGAPSWSQSVLYGSVVPLSPGKTHTFIWCVMIPLHYLHLHISPIQYRVITCGTKTVKTQADFGDKPPRIRGLYPGNSWEEAGRAEAKVSL